MLNTVFLVIVMCFDGGGCTERHERIDISAPPLVAAQKPQLEPKMVACLDLKDEMNAKGPPVGGLSLYDVYCHYENEGPSYKK